MQLGKIKGTLVDFNELEHLLDNCPSLGQWIIELRKLHDDPLEVDELVVHAESIGRGEQPPARSSTPSTMAPRSTRTRSSSTAPEDMRELQGVGRLLKEQKILDNRPTAGRPVVHNERETHEHEIQH